MLWFELSGLSVRFSFGGQGWVIMGRVMGLGYRVRLRLGMGADVRWGQKSCIQVVIAHHGRSYIRDHRVR